MQEGQSESSVQDLFANPSRKGEAYKGGSLDPRPWQEVDGSAQWSGHLSPRAPFSEKDQVNQGRHYEHGQKVGSPASVESKKHARGQTDGTP